jgi:GTP-binding nuclear protein Ran
LWLLRKLTNDPNLTLVEAPALQPEEINMTKEQIADLEKQRIEAENNPIEDNDED